MRVSMSLGHKMSQLLLGMRSSNKHKIMRKWEFSMCRSPLMKIEVLI